MILVKFRTSANQNEFRHVSGQSYATHDTVSLAAPYILMLRKMNAWDVIWTYTAGKDQQQDQL